jgi:pSer/pThr/pTyr-binding forkhead associated (FHA) protein
LDETGKGWSFPLPFSLPEFNLLAVREVTLIINTPEGEQVFKLDGNLTVGRTTQSDLALPDASLSRRHATFEFSGDDVLLFDENSTNGTFCNGEAVAPDGVRLKDADEIALGNETTIYVQIRAVQSPKSKSESPKPEPIAENQSQTPKDKKPIPKVLILAGVSTLAIVFLAIGGILIANSFGNAGKTGNQKGQPTPASADIPIAVIDPLKGEPEELDELFSFWDVQETELEAKDVEDVKATVVDPGGDETAVDLNVTRAFWEEQKAKANAPRSGSTGITPAGLNPPRELAGDGVIKQKAKLAELIGVLKYQQPMDFGDLAQKRIAKELVELPMATKIFYLEVGSSAGEGEFTSFSFDGGSGGIAPGSPKLTALQQLSENFGGQKYDLSNGRDRKQMRMRLLRMFHPRAKPILEELAKAYSDKFNRPLRITSLTRSMDYQIALNKVNPNSFKVRGAGSLPPHTSGCAFDLGRKHMNAEEQNFVMAKLADMENRGVLDALIEYNVNACFHVFIYPDGKPPKM